MDLKNPDENVKSARRRFTAVPLILWAGMGARRLFFADFAAAAASVFVGYSMRLSYYMLDGRYLRSFLLTAVLFPAVILSALFIGRCYKVLWTRASVEEYARFSVSYWRGACAFLVLYIAAYPVNIPRSSFMIFALLAFISMTGLRALMRLAFVGRGPRGGKGSRALIVGAGEAGTMLAHDIMRRSQDMVPVGFIDDDPALCGMRVASLEVFGGREKLHDAIAGTRADTVLLAMPSASGAQIAEYMKLLGCEDVAVRALPSLLALADGEVGVSRLRPVRLEDLLRREPITLDNENIRSVIEGKTVLVTGAGGSIGSEICRQVLARGPERLIALGHGENSIYLLTEALADAGCKIPVAPVIADVADEAAMRAVFERYRPAAVFHAGAHKHVPLMEDNPREALRVNAAGTYTAASLAGEYGAERFVMISTDKAVRPSSVMGATKRAAERLMFSASRQYRGTKYMAVRFGNVLGSRGSVVPKFERQIEAGGPVTVTDPRMKRYFMLIPEAVSLVLQAAAMGTGGELFALDMGRPVNISDMAKALIRLHGMEPGRDIEVRYTGVRPGEKLYEELFYDEAHVDRTAHDKIFRCRPTADEESILPDVERILSRPGLSDDEARAAIMALGAEAAP